MQIYKILKNQAQYPELLRNLSEAPEAIFAAGNLNLLNQKNFAIVGTRKCTYEGKEIAKKFAYELAEAGLNIVSGLAFGIDSYAHQGALENNIGKTIAVLGSALDKITPISQKTLGEKILENQGLLISEYQAGSKVFPSNFSLRNRIIAGISLGVLIVEAPFGSGALITAKYAQKYQRQIFAIPGSIISKNYEANNDLIKSGIAYLVTKPKDILNHLKKLSLFESDYDKKNNIDYNKSYNQLGSSDFDLVKKIINILKEKPASIDEISKKLDIEVSKILILVTQMEIAGKIKDIGNKRYAII
jgi:DNA processing protein